MFKVTFLLLALSFCLHAQLNQPPPCQISGAATTGQVITATANGNFPTCNWQAGGGGGGGTVTSVGFTGGLVSVASPTTTPALTVAGTSGGVPYFPSASTWASSAAGTANHVMLWGGAGAAPTDGGLLPVTGGTAGNPAGQTTTTTIQDNPLACPGSGTITVDNTTGLTAPGTILIEPGTNAEYVSYTGITSTTFTGVTRGIYSQGSTCRTHAMGSVVMAAIYMITHSTTDWPDLAILHGTSIFGATQNFAKISSGDPTVASSFDTSGSNEIQLDGVVSILGVENLSLKSTTPTITSTNDVLFTLGASHSLTIPTLPTTCSGHATGTLWNNSGIINACPSSISVGVTGSPLSQFASTTSAQLAGVLSDATGTGAAVFGTNPTISAVAFTTNAETSVSPTQAATSTAGNPITVAASPAIAGSGTNGAADGGAVNINAGNAARLVSGNANGGSVTVNTGALIGTGNPGDFIVEPGSGTTGFMLHTVGASGQPIIGRADACCSLYVGYASGYIAVGGASTVIGWTSTANTANFAAIPEEGFDRDGTGVIGVMTGAVQTTTLANYRDLKARQVIETPVTVATLQTCGAGNTGSRQVVTDSNAVSYTAGIGSVVATGGSTIVPVFCDGTSWRIG